MLSAQAALPTEWIDADTGHRVIRLSREAGTQSLYFHQNAYTADGKKLMVTTAGCGIATITLATGEVKPLVAGAVSVLVAGHKTGDIYYTRRMYTRRMYTRRMYTGRAPGGQASAAGGRSSAGAIVYATNVDTAATREVVKLPPGRNVASLNADETLLLGPYIDGDAPPTPAANQLLESTRVLVSPTTQLSAPTASRRLMPMTKIYGCTIP
jgi:oligogalacturonide lyase